MSKRYTTVIVLCTLLLPLGGTAATKEIEGVEFADRVTVAGTSLGLHDRTPH